MKILEFIITSAVLTLMPGPDIIFVAAQSMVQGRRAGISVALGLCSGLFVHTAAAALGLSLLISSSPYALTVIKYAGVAYLLYMGLASLKGLSRKPAACRAKVEGTSEAEVYTKADASSRVVAVSEAETDTHPISVANAEVAEDALYITEAETISAEATTKTGPAAGQASFGRLYRTGVTMNLLNPKVIIFFLALFPQFIDKSSATPKTDVLILGAIFAAVAVVIFTLVALLSDFISSKLKIKKANPDTIVWVKASVYWLIAVMFLFY